jgi:serine/threonine protein kinase
MMVRDDEPFRGNGRFEIARRLGMGGMGVVYEAYDRQRQVKVALKTLRSVTAAAVLRFKREFRALHDIQHPNLVSLGELHEERGTWFFTMELVDGVGFMEYLRPGVPRPLGDGDPTALDAAAGTSQPAPRVRARIRYDERRLRTGLAQLVRGLSALHNAGKIHRDVKPSNIMVAGERVVLLDFGLVTEPDPADSLTGDDAVGTAIYMAPEQAVGHAVDVRADWYSVGVLLYEVLVGAPPFAGNNLKVLIDKQRVMPPTPRSIDPEVPRDLDEICSALLHIEPRRRPTGDLILSRLGVHDRPSITRMAPLARASMHTQTQLLVGREPELAQLERALADTRAGRQVSVYVNGESGIGKTTLVRTFAANAAGDERVLVLSGRCYERDAVPFKALDGVIDALSRTMQKLPKVAACALVPHRASLLLQVFPVLKHVDALAEAPTHTVVDPQELRKLVFGAMRELFARIAERYTLVIAIDDLQWADADGLALLEEVLRPPEAPPVLLLATWRDPEAKTGLRQRLDALPGDVRHMALSHLAQRDAAELARALFVRASDSGMAACGDAEAIAREAAGHPLFIDELVRHSVLVLGETNPDDTVRPVRLDDVLGRRIARLEPQARAVLELVALAGTPLEQDIAARALGMHTEAFGRQATVLRAMNLTRTTGSSGMDTIECYHDRVRTSVLERLDAEARVVRHRELARALDASGRADTEALVEHYTGARELGKAGQCAVRADNY